MLSRHDGDDSDDESDDWTIPSPAQLSVQTYRRPAARIYVDISAFKEPTSGGNTVYYFVMERT